MRKSRIKSVTMETSDRRRAADFFNQIALVHLCFVKRKMEQMGMDREEKIRLLDAIISALKKQG